MAYVAVVVQSQDLDKLLTVMVQGPNAAIGCHVKAIMKRNFTGVR